jgi:hypothetical protein
MAKTRPQDIGTATETAVVRYLQTALGVPEVERRRLRGREDAGDVAGIPGLAWSVKGGAYAQRASDLDVARWLAEAETQRRHARADHAVLVMKRAGYGAARAGHWWAVMTMDACAKLASCYPRPTLPYDAPVRMTLETAVALLRCAGYGGARERQAA